MASETREKPLKERLEVALATLRGFVVLGAEIDRPETNEANAVVQRELAVVDALVEELRGSYVLTRGELKDLLEYFADVTLEDANWREYPIQMTVTRERWRATMDAMGIPYAVGDGAGERDDDEAPYGRCDHCGAPLTSNGICTGENAVTTDQTPHADPSQD